MSFLGAGTLPTTAGFRTGLRTSTSFPGAGIGVAATGAETGAGGAETDAETDAGLESSAPSAGMDGETISLPQWGHGPFVG